MSIGDMNPVMYGILKMIEYKVQIITFSQIFHDFYWHLLVFLTPNIIFIGQLEKDIGQCVFYYSFRME